MQSFRARPDGSTEWESLSFDGDHEDLLAHMVRNYLEEHGWEFLPDATREGGGED